MLWYFVRLLQNYVFNSLETFYRSLVVRWAVANVPIKMSFHSLFALPGEYVTTPMMSRVINIKVYQCWTVWMWPIKKCMSKSPAKSWELFYWNHCSVGLRRVTAGLTVFLSRSHSVWPPPSRATRTGWTTGRRWITLRGSPTPSMTGWMTTGRQ